MDAPVSTRTCLACGKTVRGRSDKKFCDDYCRNVYNNSLKTDDHSLVKHINNILRKNRSILQKLLPPSEEMTKTTKAKLVEAGFSFRYITHTYTNKKGNVYYFCYEFGYLPLEHDWCLIVKRKEEESGLK